MPDYNDKIEGAENMPGKHLSGRNNYAITCYNGDNPPCTCACPLGLDIIALVKKIQKDNFNAAYAIYRDQVLFPSIVCRICDQPCLEACIRKDIDDSVALRQLEKAVTDYAGETTPRRLNLLKKNKRIAVIGAGLSGLSCTLKLAAHGYDVTIYERNDRVGGNLWNLLPAEIFLPEIEKQMQFIEYKLSLNTEINSYEALLGKYDSILISTGKNGDSFGLLPGLNQESLGSQNSGIFLAGGLTGATAPIRSIEQGIRVSQTIESYLQTNRMHEMAFVSQTKASRLVVNTSCLELVKRVQTDHLTKEEAVREANRCILCNCEECRLSCEMMMWYRQLPLGIVTNTRNALRLTADKKALASKTSGNSTKRLVNSCNQCGLCEMVCTEKINMGEFLLESRRIMHQKGTLPPAFHDYWLRDMKSAQDEKEFLAKNAPGCDQSEYVFFPGCQLGASDPDYVKKPYTYLLEKNPKTGLILGCCGIPAEWAGDESLTLEMVERTRKIWENMGKPIVIFACPTCEKMFAKHLPDIKQTSLYEMIDQLGIPENHIAGNTTVSIFDPCASRYDESMQKSVRILTQKVGFKIEELPYRERTAQCCGYGGHIYSANPELAESIARKRVDCGPRPYITYCTNCRDIFSNHGKSCSHVIDALFNISGERRKPPSISERRHNRAVLKADLLKNIWMEDVKLEQQETELIISPELLEKLNKNLILEDDIADVIKYCESSGNKLLYSKIDSYVGHLKQGILTYWVVYKVEGSQYRVIDAYCHRFVIEGE